MAALRRLCFYVGYLVLACAVVLVCTEIGSMLVAGFYRGAYLRLSVLAPELEYEPTFRSPFSLRNRLPDDFRDASHAYDGYPWADAFLREASDAWFEWPHRYEPFRVWGNVPRRGTYINVDEGLRGAWRRTTNACAADGAPPLQVWVFGGSSVLGIDTPDFATIPSALARELNGAGGRCIGVLNLGVVGYGINQEAILLGELLKAGHRPDAVVFYDGANDAYIGGFSPGVAWAHGDLEAIAQRVERSVYVDGVAEASYAVQVAQGVLRRLQRTPDAPASARPIALKVRDTLDNYDATLTVIRTLADSYGFTTHFFWQPVLHYGARPRSAFEEMVATYPSFNDPLENETTIAVYREAERRAASGRFAFLGHVFDAVSEPVYVDSVHVGPRGNEVVARAIAAALAEAGALSPATATGPGTAARPRASDGSAAPARGSGPS